MLKRSFLFMIALYQRFLSPIKGYHCAHHRLHNGDTCSNAIKKIVIENELTNVPSLARKRFEECKQASATLRRLANSQRADISCDVPCSGPDSCGGDSLNSSCGKDREACSQPCDVCFHLNLTNRRTRRVIYRILLIVCLVLAFYYGSRITKVELRPIVNTQSTSLIERLSQRESPALRVVLIDGGVEIKSNIIETESLTDGDPILLDFERAISLDRASEMRVQDARFKAALDLLVVSQDLDRVTSPERSGTGQKYRYQFKTRWAFLNWFSL